MIKRFVKIWIHKWIFVKNTIKHYGQTIFKGYLLNGKVYRKIVKHSHRTHPINKNRVHNVNLTNVTWDQNGGGDLKIWVNKQFLKFYKVGISIVKSLSLLCKV